MIAENAYLSHIASVIHTSTFVFNLTGSRFFNPGLMHSANTDWDFFTCASSGLDTFLTDAGFKNVSSDSTDLDAYVGSEVLSIWAYVPSDYPYSTARYFSDKRKGIRPNNERDFAQVIVLDPSYFKLYLEVRNVLRALRLCTSSVPKDQRTAHWKNLLHHFKHNSVAHFRAMS